MFLSIQLICQSLFLFCLLKLLYTYQDNNTEHHKVIYPPYSRNCQVLQKKRKQTKIFLFLATKRLCSVLLLVDITHYWLFKFLVEVKFLVGRQISSRSLVNVNCKYASEEIYPVLLAIHKKQQY